MSTSLVIMNPHHDHCDSFIDEMSEVHHCSLHPSLVEVKKLDSVVKPVVLQSHCVKLLYNCAWGVVLGSCFFN